MRTIKKIHQAVSDPIDDLVTYRALPTDSIQMDTLNPFIFLNHHGPQNYPPGNAGLPFGPHPHRGIETVTFILDGDIMHKDTGGNKSIITSGGIQWMRAGKGLIHSEVSSDDFKSNGGNLEILQLWLNLPEKDKMLNPLYKGLQKNDIPEVKEDGVIVKILSGDYKGTTGPFESPASVNLFLIYFNKNAAFKINIPKKDKIFFYVVKGDLDVNGTKTKAFNLVEFDNNEEEISVKSNEESILILGYALPLKERIVAYGPFVMNSESEIMEAYEDFRAGRFGKWRE
jgi:redox-sensitive bicupin YhaK (pirin superfamily)